MTISHGTPCWYELTTGDASPAMAFYGSVLEWTFEDSGMEGAGYTLAAATDGGTVAGVMDVGGQDDAPPPSWLVYFACDDCDTTANAAAGAGGGIVVEPTDIPGTGRFAVCSDPQGAVFGILQPEPMEEEPTTPAFDQDATGHGNWHELMTTDPQAGFAFYAELFGWGKGEAMDMGETGTYQLFQDRGKDIGGVMGLADWPAPAWLPYFGVVGVEEAMARIEGGGGTVMHGPVEVPGEAFIAVAQDPQGAFFAVTGPKSG